MDLSLDEFNERSHPQANSRGNDRGITVVMGILVTCGWIVIVNHQLAGDFPPEVVRDLGHLCGGKNTRKGGRAL